MTGVYNPLYYMAVLIASTFLAIGRVAPICSAPMLPIIIPYISTTPTRVATP